MAGFDSIDAWFEKGFRVRRGSSARAQKRDAVRSKGGGAPASGGVKFSSQAKARNIQSVIRKAPEVMVKITGSSNGLTAVKRHLDYISRNGEIELQNESGESLKGRQDLRDFREQLKASQIPQEGSKREFLHVMFSMPKGTPEKAVHDAVTNFCREEFAGRRYVTAAHDDTDHVHVHVCVGTRDIDRADAPRLSPRKADLSRWRQGFAEKLRDEGLDAAASERRHRFNHKRPEHPVVRQIQADNPASPKYNARRAADRAQQRVMAAQLRPESAFVGPSRPPRVPRVHVDGRTPSQRPENPAHARIEATRESTLKTWREAGQELRDAGAVELAEQLQALIREGEKPVKSAAQERFDASQGAQRGTRRGEDTNRSR